MCYIIAEIGFNHEGSMRTAVEMIRAAADSGADAVKFQTFRASDIALPTSPHYENIRCGEMNEEQHEELCGVARDCGIDFISTPFGPWAVELLEKIGVPAFKVASMDCTNRHLLGYIAETGKPIYLSTGMARLHEIEDSLNFLRDKKSGPVTLLHCISKYPAEPEDLNLEIIPLLKQLFQTPVGYSDHYPGAKACLAAAMMGAEVVETHFTLDASKKDGDHNHSVEPTSLEKLVSDIRLFNIMKGDRRAVFNRPDRRFAGAFRRGVHASRELSAGRSLAENDILLCRPASELSPNDLAWLVGKRLSRDVPAHAAIGKNSVDD